MVHVMFVCSFDRFVLFSTEICIFFSKYVDDVLRNRSSYIASVALVQFRSVQVD